MNRAEQLLEFYKIKDLLCELALTDGAKKILSSLSPSMRESDCLRRMEETTVARTILDTCGAPPLVPMRELEKLLTLARSGAMLLPDQLASIAQFLVSCRRIKAYLKKAEAHGPLIAGYGDSFLELPELLEELEKCIRNELVDSAASPALRDLRRRIDTAKEQIKSKLANILSGKKNYFSDGSVVMRNGRYVLPVRREYKNQVPGTVVDISGTGGTCFIEPLAVTKLQSELSSLELEEDNEVRRVLYTLTSMVDDNAASLSIDIEAVETLDVLFAKAKLSAQMDGIPVEIGMDRHMVIRGGRHPLLNRSDCIPLNFEIGEDIRGVIITGPNTGGKTVALKTVGLLSMMAQCGLHIPAEKGSHLCMHNLYLCDIGDGQSITENLSTFSAHLTNIIEILSMAGPESLVLLDELGSGTDPAEGMGIAVAVLEELRRRGCLFLVTTHYPEVKEYAEGAPGLMNARMAFDRETLRPLYRLELGEAGESCALYIAERLGFPSHLLGMARQEAYRTDRREQNPTETPALRQADRREQFSSEDRFPDTNTAPHATAPRLIKKVPTPSPEQGDGASAGTKFHLGDSVIITPEGETGIVFQSADGQGNVGVQVKGQKRRVNHKRLKLQVAASELYPEDYDFSILFDTVENRKARRQMEKGHQPGLTVTYSNSAQQ